MSDLKTLKDLEFYYIETNWISGDCIDGTFSVDIKELKQEAIKWINNMKKIYEKGDTLFKEHGKLTSDFELNVYDYEQDDVAGALKFAKYFFNITEEDLK